MRVYIELRRGDSRFSTVKDWRVILDEEDATIEIIASKARELTWNGLDVGDIICVYKSDMTAEQLRLPR